MEWGKAWGNNKYNKNGVTLNQWNSEIKFDVFGEKQSVMNETVPINKFELMSKINVRKHLTHIQIIE